MIVKYYELELIERLIKKYKYTGRGVDMYVFDYKNFNLAKKVINKNDAIYLIVKEKNSNELYIGQTTSGPQRFSTHSMKKYINKSEIYYFTFESQPNKNILDFIERRLIELIKSEGYILKNGNKGTISNIEPKDEQFVNQKIDIINYLLQIIGVNIEGLEDIKKIDKIIKRENSASMKNDFDEKFYLKQDGVNCIFKRENEKWILEKGSKTLAKDWWEKNSSNSSISNYSFYNMFIDYIDDNGLVKKDIVWNSISPIVAFSKGISTNNGWVAIKNNEGKTPDELYRK